MIIMKAPRWRAALRALTPLAVAATSPCAAAEPALATPSLSLGRERSADVLALQVLMDRQRHSPGAIDGIMGRNTRRAILAYQRQRGLPTDGRISPALLTSLRQIDPRPILETYTITQEDAARTLVRVPASMTGKAELDKVAFERDTEALAEQFHMSEALLRRLNPDKRFDTVGTQVRIVSAGSEQLPETVSRIEVDKKRSALRAFSADGSLLATYPATVGSSTFPSPHGRMEVRAVAPSPAYYFDPDHRSWGPDRHLTIAPGPNNPVGSTWIDLTEPGYGIHGTPEPSLIGKTSSHGCVRLTNWDAEELGASVAPGTVVEFL